MCCSPKQMASVDLLSGGRLTAGLGLGGWPEDYGASSVPSSGGGALWRTALKTMREVWAGQIVGQGGPTSPLPQGRPMLLFGGLVPAAHVRAATEGQGWVAPLFGLPMLEAGAAAVRQAWATAGRPGEPRIATGRYCSLGRNAETIADDYLRHYYGGEFWRLARADTLTSPAQLREEVERLAHAGVTDLVLYPSSAELDQVGLLAEALPLAHSCDGRNRS